MTLWAGWRGDRHLAGRLALQTVEQDANIKYMTSTFSSDPSARSTGSGRQTSYPGRKNTTPVESILQIVLEQQADILGISATMTPPERDVAALIASVRLTLTGGDSAILVGGYPF